MFYGMNESNAESKAYDEIEDAYSINHLSFIVHL